MHIVLGSGLKLVNDLENLSHHNFKLHHLDINLIFHVLFEY